jgi:hypothetical protein
MASARQRGWWIAVAACGWLLAAPGVSRAQPDKAQPIIVAGLRPTTDRAYKSVDIKRLPEAQRLREIVDATVREIAKRPILNHGGLRAALGRSYLVDFFDCSGSVECVIRLFSRLGDRASLIVYGDYGPLRKNEAFRMRLVDLAGRKLLAEVEFAFPRGDLDDRDSWRRELVVLLAAAELTGDAEDGEEGGTEPVVNGGGSTEDPGLDPEGAGGGDEGSGQVAALDAGLDELDTIESDADSHRGANATDQGPLVRRLRATLASELRSYPLERGGPANDEQMFLDTDFELDVRVHGGSSFFFRPRFMIDLLDNELKRFEPYEGYFQYAGDTWDFRAGQFIDNWGIADAFNPLDIINRRDFGHDMVDPPALGELGVHTRVQLPSAGWFGEPTIGAYVLPLWRETPLPTENNRFSLSQPPFVLVDDPEYPEAVEDGVFAALRFEHTVNSDALSADFQYIGARGPSRVPAFTPIPQDDGSIQLVTGYYGAWTGGGGFRLVPGANWWSKLTFKAEVAYTRPYLYDDSLAEAPERYVQFVGGFDRVIDALFADKDSLTLTIEYLGEELADDFASQLRPFENDVAARLFWEAKDFARTAIELRGVVDVKTGEMLGEATIGRQLRFIHDDLRLEIAGQGIRPQGDETSFFSLFPNNSNVRARMAFNF